MTALHVWAGTGCVSNNRNIGLEWNNALTWDDRASSTKLLTTRLASKEIETIKRAAFEALRTAFPPETGVRFEATLRVTDRISVQHIDRTVLGESYVCGALVCPPSRVNDDLYMTLAQEYAKDRGLTDRTEDPARRRLHGRARVRSSASGSRACTGRRPSAP